MPTYKIYGYSERTPFAEVRLIQAEDLPQACRAADNWFPDGCVTNAQLLDTATILPDAWFDAKRRQIDRAIANSRPERDDDREPRRFIHCDYSDADALEYGPRG